MLKRILVFLFLSGVYIISSGQKDSMINTKDTLKLKAVPESLQDFMEELIKTNSKKSEENPDIEIDGLIIDQTKTKSGRDFLDFFISKWEAPSYKQNFTLYIDEIPYRLRTTRIVIKLNETTVFKSFLQPRIDIIEQIAIQAVSQTEYYLLNYEEMMKQLEGADQEGTGIF